MAVDYEEYYDEGYEAAEWRAWGARLKVDNLLRLAGTLDGLSVLELGCGDGAVSRELLARSGCAAVTGLDIAESAIRRARGASTDPRLRFEVYDGSTAPFADGSFDLVVSSHVLEHVRDPRAYLGEVRRLAPLAAIEVPLEDNLRLGDAARNVAIGHINYFRLSTLRALFASCGLEVVGSPLVTWPQLHRFSPGFRPLVSDALKTTLLRVAPPVARGLATYHATVLVRPA